MFHGTKGLSYFFKEVEIQLFIIKILLIEALKNNNKPQSKQSQNKRIITEIKCKQMNKVS